MDSASLFQLYDQYSRTGAFIIGRLATISIPEDARSLKFVPGWMPRDLLKDRGDEFSSILRSMFCNCPMVAAPWEKLLSMFCTPAVFSANWFVSNAPDAPRSVKSDSPRRGPMMGILYSKFPKASVSPPGNAI